LKVNATLTNIDLEDNGIDDDGVAAIADALKVNCTLTKINLEDNDIGDYGAAVIADALKVNRTLMQINLKRNDIGEDGTAVIANVEKYRKDKFKEILLCLKHYNYSLYDAMSSYYKKNICDETLIELDDYIKDDYYDSDYEDSYKYGGLKRRSVTIKI